MVALAETREVSQRKLTHAIQERFLIGVQVTSSNFTDLLDVKVYDDIDVVHDNLVLPLQFTPLTGLEDITTQVILGYIEGLGLGKVDEVLSDNERDQRYVTVVLDKPTIKYTHYNKVHSFFIDVDVIDEHKNVEDTLTFTLNYVDNRVLGGLSVHTGTKLSGQKLSEVLLDSFLGRYGALPTALQVETKDTKSFLMPDRSRTSIIVEHSKVTFLGNMSHVTVDLTNVKGEVVHSPVTDVFGIVMTGKGKNPDVVRLVF